jgi:hypothetical protein
VTRSLRTAVALAAAAVFTMAGAAGAAAAARPYSYESAPYSASPRFAVAYAGSGRWRTDFHATPPNPGGDPDTNDAHDASAEWWRLELDGTLATADPSDLSGAHGRTQVIGHVDHTHVDGLFSELDRTVRCTVRGSTGPAGAVEASVAFRHAAGSRAYTLAAGDPLATVLTDMPTVCPDQGDSIDRILDNYFTPGFSFAPGWGPAPWLTSRTVAIPAAVLHRAARVDVVLRPRRAGRPPAGCAVQNPAYETCATGGSWVGMLTLRRTG